MKKYLLFIFIFCGLHVLGQQQALFTQYMYNDLIFNPAISGVKDYTPINLNTRRQWVGIKEAPFTQTLSAHGYLQRNIGIGGVVFNQVTGPTRRTGLSISSAYHLKLSKDRYGRFKKQSKALSFGMAFTLSQFVADKSKLVTRDPNDPAVDNAFNYKLIPDVSVGLYYHDANNYYVGISALNLIQSKNDLYLTDTTNVNKVVRNYYLMAGGNYDMSDMISFQPSVLFQMIESLPFQAELTVLMFFDKTFYFGGAYRLQDAVSGLVGYKNEVFRFGYSYDYTLSDLQGYNTGSHEVNLTLFLRKPSGRHKNKVKRGDRIRIRRRNEYSPDITEF